MWSFAVIIDNVTSLTKGGGGGGGHNLAAFSLALLPSA